MINDAISGFGIAEAPHGGFKQSGIGRTHGKLGLAEMVQIKYVDVDLLPRMPKVWWYGYGAGLPAPNGRIHRHVFRQKLGARIERSHECHGERCGVPIESEQPAAAASHVTSLSYNVRLS